MNWPVGVINEVNEVKRLNWKRYLLLFLFLCVLLGVSICGVNYLYSGYFDNLSSAVIFLYGVLVIVFLILLSFKAYIYSVQLTVYEACKAESEKIKQQWIHWASKRACINGYRFFSPEVIDIQSVINNSAFDVHTSQLLSLHQGESGRYKEIEIYIELLSSVRAVIKEIDDRLSFRIIFINSANPLSFSFFKSAWLECGFREEKIVSHDFYSSGLWDSFIETIDDGINDKITIVLSVNLSDVAVSSNNSTEFASLNIFSVFNSPKAQSVVYRPMFCTRGDLKQGLLLLVTYQPDICLASAINFCGVSEQDIALITSELKKAANSLSREWFFSIKDLGMTFGVQDDKHAWLSLCYLSDVCKASNRSQLMVSKNSDGFLFSLIAPQSPVDVVGDLL
ncbi:hypothetical protein SRABI13_00160 [Erwinia aphidicola]|uniref:hypothetical protein n=1 Tax=Erwinia aphidicola TaxID=68334 RepID=UPI001D8C4B10|nr:hypothetical protein [Erwinia aphidicola]CAH0135932.1 hypothetical protein SRABI13_00160 [Erwinia aphidicola]